MDNALASGDRDEAVAEFSATETLERLRELLGMMSDMRNRVKDDEQAVIYFVTGEYAKDSWEFIQLFKKLDEHMSTYTSPVWLVPRQWNVP